MPDVDDLYRSKMACIELSSAFAYFLDRRDYGALADLFTVDGVWTRYGIDLRGRDALVMELNKRPLNQFTRHVTTGHYFTNFEEESASSVSQNISVFSFENAAPPFRIVPGNMIVLDFEDTYTRTSSGWRFASRLSRPLLVPDALWTVFTDHE